MTKETYQIAFVKSLDKNFAKRSVFFGNADYEVFHELTPIIFEINKCVILEFHSATITLTNHFLERLLKLALITNEVGIGPTPMDNWNDVYEEPHKKYDSITLGKSIELCKKHDLISEKEKEYLFNTIRDLMRNGFSHADAEKILKGVADEGIFFQGDFSNPGKLHPVKMNQKKIPVFQSLLIGNFAKANAEPYFDSIFELSKRIEKRLLAKYENSK